MNSEDIENLNVIKLNSSFTFESVKIDNFHVNKYCNTGISEVNVYTAEMTSINTIEYFFAGYLKLLYIELFEGESGEEIKDAYLNIITNYKLRLQPFFKEQLLNHMISYFSQDDLKKFKRIISEVTIVYQSGCDEDIYLLASQKNIFLLEYEHE